MAPSDHGDATCAGTGPRGREAPASDVAPAPRVLSQRADPDPLPPPLHDAEEVTTLHVKWAQLAGAGQGAAAQAGDRGDAAAGGLGAGGVRAKVRARVVAAARADAAGDRALIGDLIRAVDVIAARVDDMVELLVQEVLDSLSEDLARVQAALGTLDEPAGHQP